MKALLSTATAAQALSTKCILEDYWEAFWEGTVEKNQFPWKSFQVYYSAVPDEHGIVNFWTSAKFTKIFETWDPQL